MNIKSYVEQLNKYSNSKNGSSLTYSPSLFKTNNKINYQKEILINTLKDIDLVKKIILIILNLDKYPEGKYIKNKSQVYKWLPELKTGINIPEWINLIKNNISYSHLLAPSQKEELLNIFYYLQKNTPKLRKPASSILSNLPNKDIVLHNMGLYLDNIIDIFKLYQETTSIVKELQHRIPLIARYNLIFYGLRPLLKS